MLCEDEERLILARVAERDPDAIRKFVRANQGPVYRFARRLLRDPAVAEDVTQDTLLAAVRAADRHRGGSVKAWLFTIARNRVASVRRRRVGEPSAHLPLEALGREAGWGAEDDTLARIELRSTLEVALQKISEEDRELLLLRDVEGLSGPETAEALGLSLAAMKSRLHRARLRLAAAVRQGGIDGRT